MAINLNELGQDIKMIQEMAISDSEKEVPRYQEYLKNNRENVLDDSPNELRPDKVVQYILYKHREDVTALSYIASELNDPKNHTRNSSRVRYVDQENNYIPKEYDNNYVSIQSSYDNDIKSLEDGRKQEVGLDPKVSYVIANSDPEVLARKLSKAMSKSNGEHQFDLSKVMAACSANVGNKLAEASGKITAIEGSRRKKLWSQVKNGISRVFGSNGLKDSDIDKIIHDFARISKEDIKGVNLAEIPKYADKFKPLQNLIERNNEKSPITQPKTKNHTQEVSQETKEVVRGVNVVQDSRVKLEKPEWPPILTKEAREVGKAFKQVQFASNIDSQKGAMDAVRKDRMNAKRIMLGTISDADNINAFAGGHGDKAPDAEKVLAIQEIVRDADKLLKHNIESIDAKIIQLIRKIIGKDTDALEAFDGVVKNFQDRIEAIESRRKIEHAPNIRRPSMER